MHVFPLNRPLCTRLQMVADFVRDGAAVADIGTDHAYLPVALVLSGKCPRAVVSDLREMPLENARQAIRRYHLEDRIVACLSDGLDEIAPDWAQDIGIAAMGGELIAAILARAPWLRNEGKRLILQPMTHAEDVRRFLYKNGFSILKENAVQDGSHFYIALCAQYTGAPTACSPGLPYLGRLPECHSEAALIYLNRQHQRLLTRVEALRRSRRSQQECARLEAAAAEIGGAMRKMAEPVIGSME